MMGAARYSQRSVYRLLKRVFDCSVAVVGLVGLSPILAVLLAAQWRIHGWPLIFVQRRPGKDGKLFNLLKFRTMTNQRGDDGELLSDGARLTPFGRWLRSTSLDEVPELLNVFWGDMSLVGPRPLLEQYLPLYSAGQARRHDVRPGITGWAQINGRNNVAWQDRFDMDVWYVDNASFLLDIKILMRTFFKVLKKDGISQDGEATVAYFEGNDPNKA